MIDTNILLAWGATFKKYCQGDIIFEEGASCNFYFQLIEGRVKWVNFNSEGKEFIQTIIEPNESFGELPLFDEGPYAACAIADEDCLIMRLKKETFTQLICENSDINLSFTKLLAKRQRYEFLLLKTIAFENPEKRISTLLTHFKNKQVNTNRQLYQVNLTRQQIANMTGLRVETVIREIRNLNLKGRLQIIHGKVFV